MRRLVGQPTLLIFLVAAALLSSTTDRGFPADTEVGVYLGAPARASAASSLPENRA